MAKIKINKICSKERVGRLLIALLVIFAAIFLIFLGPIARAISLFIGLYLLITALVGSCLFYAVFKK